MNEFDEISLQIQVKTTAPYYDSVRERVLADLERMKIIGEFHDMRDSLMHGETKVFIQKLARKYNLSEKTIKKYVYPLPKSEKS